MTKDRLIKFTKLLHPMALGDCYDRVFIKSIEDELDSITAPAAAPGKADELSRSIKRSGSCPERTNERVSSKKMSHSDSKSRVSL